MRKNAIKKSGVSTLHEINKTDNCLQVSNESCIMQTHSNLDLITNEKIGRNTQYSTKELIPGRRSSQNNNAQNFKKSHSP